MSIPPATRWLCRTRIARLGTRAFLVAPRMVVALILCSAAALAAQEPAQPQAPVQPLPCRGDAARVEWLSLAPPGDRATLDLWCDSVGPPLLVAGRPESAAAAVVVVSWNIHVGHAEVERLIEWIDRAPEVAKPYALVLLLQEAVRGGPEVPAAVPPGMEPPGEIRAREGTLDVAAMAARFGLHAAYVPSMRNGRLFAPDAQQDRGNAILSTHPLSRARAIELPFFRQRRVAVAATVAVPGFAPLDVMTMHLDAKGKRTEQAKALAPHLGALAARGPLVAGGDLNTWSGGRRETAFKVLDAVLPEDACGRGPTNTWPLRLHLFFGWWRGRLDYMFSNLDASGIERRCETIDRQFDSDHNPVVMVIHH